MFDPHHMTEEGLPTETQTLCLGAYGDVDELFNIKPVKVNIFSYPIHRNKHLFDLLFRSKAGIVKL